MGVYAANSLVLKMVACAFHTGKVAARRSKNLSRNVGNMKAAEMIWATFIVTNPSDYYLSFTFYDFLHWKCASKSMTGTIIYKQWTSRCISHTTPPVSIHSLLRVVQKPREIIIGLRLLFESRSLGRKSSCCYTETHSGLHR